MSESKGKKAIKACARLILAGRYGRACRVYARHFKQSPRLLRDKKARHKWATENR